jgi:hypothetical protein
MTSSPSTQLTGCHPDDACPATTEPASSEPTSSRAMVPPTAILLARRRPPSGAARSALRRISLVRVRFCSRRVPAGELVDAREQPLGRRDEAVELVLRRVAQQRG